MRGFVALLNKYYWSDHIMRICGYVACMGDMRKAHRGLVGKPEGKRPLGRRNCRFKGNIKIDVNKIG